jgi:hypothetical protein
MNSKYFILRSLGEQHLAKCVAIAIFCFPWLASAAVSGTTEAAFNNGRFTCNGFGYSSAVSGDTAVFGASLPGDFYSSEEVYVFVRNGANWNRQAVLRASNGELVDMFGESVAISGDTIVVAASAEDSDATGINGSQTNNSAINSGAVYIFVRNGTNWTQQAYLKASNTGAHDRFGASVAISGDTVVVGANSEDSNATGISGDQTNNLRDGSGAAYVFVRNGTNWTQQAYLKASNTGSGDVFGSSLSVSDNTLVVGAEGEDSSAIGINGNQSDNTATNSGAAYVFVRNGTTWTQQAYLKASNTGASDFFGDTVSISGDSAVVGAFGEDSNATGINGNPSSNTATDSGAAYVFVRNGTTWTQEAYLKASNTEAGDAFGRSVAACPRTVVVGADGEDSAASGINGAQADNSAPQAGAAYVFVRSGSNWLQQAYLKFFGGWWWTEFLPLYASRGPQENFLGRSVGVSDSTVVVGAWGLDDSYDIDFGYGRRNDGAAFVYTDLGPPLLKSLSLAGVTYSPSFSSQTSSYSATVEYPLSSTSIVPVAGVASNKIEVRINSGAYSEVLSGSASGQLALNVGINVIDIRVTDAGGISTIYTVTVARSAPRTNADLSSLLLSAGDLTPSFVSTATFYTIVLVNPGNSIVITPSSADTAATVDVRANSGAFSRVTNGSQSAPLSLNAGVNTIDIRVTAQDSITVKNYSFTLLSNKSDTDSDGLNDAAEFKLSPLGFNWQLAQASLVSLLRDNAILADLYPAGSVMDLRLAGLMIQKQGSNAVVSFQPQTTTDLQTIPFTNNGAVITNVIPMPSTKGFLRVRVGGP